MSSSGLTYESFLNQVIEGGLAGILVSYAHEPDKLKGSREGFEACRGKTPDQLWELLVEARRRSWDAQREMAENYWEVRHTELQIEWTCNCVSAMLQNEGLPTIVPPTARAVLRVHEILGR